jgi:hypothetical protein
MDGEQETTPDLIPDQSAQEEVAPVAEQASTEERFTDLDPAEKPEGEITPEWLQERYKQMQADYTRKRQADSETAKQRAEELEFLEALRSDKEVQQAVFEQLQELLSEEEMEELEEELEGGEESDLERQVRELREVEEQRQASALASQLVTHIEELAKEAKFELDEQDMKEIFDAAISGDEVSTEATLSAFKAFHARREALREKWLKEYVQSKQPATQIPSGTSATEKADLSDRDARISRMAAILGGS